MLLVSLDPGGRSFTYANAGHPAGYVLGAAGEITAQLNRTGLPLGIKPDVAYPQSPSTGLSVGDILLLLTDGIEEAMSPEETLFGAEGVLQAVRVNREKSPRETADERYAVIR